jgi:hypothetical protein
VRSRSVGLQSAPRVPPESKTWVEKRVLSQDGFLDASCQWRAVYKNAKATLGCRFTYIRTPVSTARCATSTSHHQNAPVQQNRTEVAHRCPRCGLVSKPLMPPLCPARGTGRRRGHAQGGGGHRRGGTSWGSCGGVTRLGSFFRGTWCQMPAKADDHRV